MQVVPFRGGVMKGENQLGYLCLGDVVAHYHVGLADCAPVAHGKRAVVHWVVERFPDTARNGIQLTYTSI